MLDQDQIDAFRRDGAVLLRGVLTPEEVETLRAASSAISPGSGRSG